MFEPYDIFRLDNDGQPIWLESAPELAQAKSKIRQLGDCRPGDYLIFCHKTQDKIFMTAGGSRGD
jgi:hypothetical protein